MISKSRIFHDAFSGYIFIGFCIIIVTIFMNILKGSYPLKLLKCRIERTFRRKPAYKGNIFQAVHLFRQYRFGILHPIPVDQRFYIAVKYLINGIRQVSSIRAEYYILFVYFCI